MMKNISANPIKIVPPLKNKTNDSVSNLKNNDYTPW